MIRKKGAIPSRSRKKTIFFFLNHNLFVSFITLSMKQVERKLKHASYCEKIFRALIKKNGVVPLTSAT